MSFHGCPNHSDQRRPITACVTKTARLLAQELGLNDSQWQLTFQSRFDAPNGCSPIQMPPAGAAYARRSRSCGVPWTRRPPGNAGKSQWKERRLSCTRAAIHDYIPALNDHPALIKALTSSHRVICRVGLPQAVELTAQTAQAQALGASGVMDRRGALRRMVGGDSLAGHLHAMGCAEFAPVDESATPGSRADCVPMIAPGPHWCSVAAVRAVPRILACSRCSEAVN